MTVTSVDIDDELLKTAKSVLGVGTTRAAVDQALRESVMRRRQAAALDSIAELGLEPNAAKVDAD